MTYLFDWQDPSAAPVDHGVLDRSAHDLASLDRIERALLGTLIVVPNLLSRRAVEHLRPADFRSSRRGAVLDAMRACRETYGDVWTTPLLCEELWRRRERVPAGEPGWGAVLAEIQFDACPEDETVDVYASKIAEAAVLRKTEAWRRS